MPEPAKKNDANFIKQVIVGGLTGGVSAWIAFFVVAKSPSWPIAFGVAAVAAIIGATICVFFPKRKK